MSAATIQEFYRRWYRPEHMAVICIGDVKDPDAVVGEIRATFEQLQASDSQQAEPIPQ